ncbi:hypothetical protein ABZW30_45755 [Kitasatospora sp. NPDC004669]|uniref:hypothetical protein n=1 Tax=Kitasatospora sp. NPDC004669 TaxID=3154555 RepID=UPI0033AB4F42
MIAPLPTAPANIPLPARLPIAARLPLLGLYPAEYRAAHGEEIAAVFAEAVQDLAGRAALREWAALAAHALRLRTRLSSSDSIGRIAAGAAPLILAGGAGMSMASLLIELFLRNPFGSENSGHPASRALVVAQSDGWGHPAIQALVVAQTCSWILALLCACLGRWAPVRILVVLGILGRIGPALAFIPHRWLADVLPYMLLMPFGIVPCALLLIAPPDAVDLSLRGRRETVLAALTLMSGAAILWPHVSGYVLQRRLFLHWGGTPDLVWLRFMSFDTTSLLMAIAAWPAAVMSTALLHHLGAQRPDRLRAAGIAVAVLPWAAMLPPPYYFLLAPAVPEIDSRDLVRNASVVLALLATATLLAALRRTLRRARPTDPPGLA